MLMYLRNNNKIIGKLTVENSIPVNLEIRTHSDFLDIPNTTTLENKDLLDWIYNRVCPESQRGLENLLDRLNIDYSNPNWYIALFFKTKGVNIKDRIWISSEEDEEESELPWNDILYTDKVIESIDDVNFANWEEIIKNKAPINIDGACEKNIIKVNGELAIIKRALQGNTYDAIAEELTYKIASALEIDAAPTYAINSEFSYTIVDEKKDLIRGGDLFQSDSLDMMAAYEKIVNIANNDTVKIDFLRMILFDIIVRQVDRNTTNYSFYYSNGELRLYRLYDNGLSLFSTTRYSDKKEFLYNRTNSTEVLQFALNELKRLGIKRIFNGAIDEQYLLDLFSRYEKDIKSRNGNEYRNIVNWVISSYKEIIEVHK